MSKRGLVCLVFVGAFVFASLVGCVEEKKEPDFSGYSRIAELATLECTYHNVAEIYNDGTDMLFGINVGYKKAWFEYDGTVQLGVDVSKVRIDKPDENNVVIIAVPSAQVLGQADADEDSISDIYSDTGWFTSITSADQSEAYVAAQESMKESAESNDMLIAEATDRARTLLSQYVIGIGEQLGQKYEIKFVDAE